MPLGSWEYKEKRVTPEIPRTVRLILLLLLVNATAFPQPPITFVFAGLKLLPDVWDKQANFARFEQYARRAAAAGADFIATPEGYLDGYSAHDGMVKKRTGKDLTRERYFEGGEPIDGPWMRKVAALARELKKYLLMGFAERRGGKMFNTVAVYSPEGLLIARYSKAHCGPSGEPYNEAGNEFPVFPTPIGRLGLLVCFDRQLPETSRILAIKGAQFIVVPAFGLGTTEINEDIMMRTRAYENSVYVAHVHPVNTFIVDPKGTIVAQSRRDGETIVMATITLDRRVGSGEGFRARRPEIYKEILLPNQPR
jgi:predicted amidohydrolase